MAATIHMLTPGPRSETALRNELRDGWVRILDELARQMLDSADDALFRMSEAAGSDVERRTYVDTMRVLRLGRDAFLKIYTRQLVLDFNAGPDTPGTAAIAFDYTSLSLQQNDELEERIALGNLATRVDGLMAGAAHQLERRLDSARAQGLRIPPRMLGARTVCNAFGKAAAGLSCGFDIKLIVYKLFERVLCRDYGRLLAHATEVLDRHGIEAQVVSAPAAGSAPPAAASTPWNPAHRWQTQTSGWFDDLLASPSLSTRLRIAFEGLRQPLAQRAAQDPMIASDPQHPVRQRLTELVELAATVAADPAAASSFNIVIETALGATTDTAAPSLDRMVLRLREQLHDQRTRLLRQVRSEVIREIELRSFGRTLTDEIRTLLRSGIAPLMALHLLNSGRNSSAFKAADSLCDRLLASLELEPPLRAADQMARLALQGELRGALASIGMAEARIVELLDGLIRAWAEGHAPLPAHDQDPDQDPADPDPDTADDPLPAVEPVLMAVGSAPPQMPVAAAPVVTAASGDADAPTVLTARVLLPESWFRVFDPAQNQTRWLKLSSYYAAEDQVTFSGFDESKRLSLRASRFVSDLLEGRSEAINPSADARAALERLRVIEPPPDLAAAHR